MPFIKGRYYVNPVLGQALEAAREAEEAIRQAQAASLSDATGYSQEADAYKNDDQNYSSKDASAQGPIHHIEIEAAELVPSATGRAQRGFAARVHRAAPVGAQNVAPGGNAWRKSSNSSAPLAPETHVFANHGDLLDFLRDALAHDASRNAGLSR